MLNLPIKILQTQKLTAETITVTFDNIDTLVAQWDAANNITSRHLVLLYNARSIDASLSTTMFLRFNDTVADMYYMYQRLSGVDAVDSAGRVDGANAINLPPITGANLANSMGGGMAIIPHAFNTTNHKTVLALGGSSERAVELVAGRYNQTDPIASVQFWQGVGDDFVVGSTFSLGVVDERYLVEEVVLAADGQPTFDNIPQGEGDLVAVGYCRSDRAAGATLDWVGHWINDDQVAGNYVEQFLEGDGAATSAYAFAHFIATTIANHGTANAFGSFVASYSQYNKNNQPHILTIGGGHESSGPSGKILVSSARRSNTEPINKISFNLNIGTDFKAGSLFSLYRVPKRIVERIELTEGAPTITFDNIPQNFEALVLSIYTRSDRVAVQDEVLLTINDDAVDANYDFQYVLGQGVAVTASRVVGNRSYIYVPGATEGINEFASGSLIFPQYAESDRHKHYIQNFGNVENNVWMISKRWKNTNAITKIVLTTINTDNFVAGSVFELEGILRKEGLPPVEGQRWG